MENDNKHYGCSKDYKRELPYIIGAVQKMLNDGKVTDPQKRADLALVLNDLKGAYVSFIQADKEKKLLGPQ